MAFSHQCAEPLHLVIDGLDGGVCTQEFPETLSLSWVEAVGVFAQGGEVAPVMFDGWSDLAAQFHEVMLDEPDDMEAVSHDTSLGKVALDQRAVASTHVDADDAHFMPSL